MFRQLNLLLVLCGCLVGCQSAPSFAKWPGHPERRESEKRPLINDLSMDDLRDIEEELFIKAGGRAIEQQQAAVTPRSSFEFDDLDEPALAGAEREFLREQIVASARGSQVGVSDESGGRYSGTVLRAGPDRLDMMNCLSQEAIPGPAGQRQCKTSHIPFLTIETSAVTHFVTVSSPPPDFPATDDEFDGTEYSVAEIVNRSGHRQRWGKPPVMGDSNRGTASLNLE